MHIPLSPSPTSFTTSHHPPLSPHQHRVSTIMNMDKILVISRGEMIECGTVDELLDARGAFASMALRKE